ncbi:MAG: UDP-N-acetylmuramoyl-L-alanyl-D-glutamate--2,6-diaminopimelate ligase [Collinsella sp.]|nr:UDP-N-acetylmuramoyl-L-alanyl-D-glutamate--2,6-diaminopimelate ligase [Collinsella sp.]
MHPSLTETKPSVTLQVPGTLGEYRTILSGSGSLVELTGGASDLGDLPITHVSYDSRSIREGSLFICKGAAFKEEYLLQAIESGAVAYVSQTPYPRAHVPGLIVDDIRAVLAPLAARAYGYPASDLRISTFTGTKGKTTSSFYLKSILDKDAKERGGAPTALISSVVVDDGAERIPSKLTSPEPLELNLYLARARRAGASDVVMESSSQALKYGRVAGLRFAVGAFTNISEDHISPIEHPTFEDYFSSKLGLFAQCDAAVVNLDMDRVDEVLSAAKACERTITYSLSDPSADVTAISIEQRGHRTLMQVRTPRFTGSVLVSSVADFNLSNALGAIACAEALGASQDAIENGLADVQVPGRMEYIPSPDPEVTGIVDFAHNEVSLRALLGNVRRSYPDRELCVVFGATGDKGIDRREGMGRAAGELADRIIATEDDAGTEDVRSICETIRRFALDAGATDVVIEPDRERAMRLAIRGRRGPSVVVLAGKGSERHMARPGGYVPYEGDAEIFGRVLVEELGGGARDER